MNPEKPITVPIPRWVISDTHFCHENILDYCPWRRTWAGTVAQHDAALIDGWQHQVKADDWVLHLGDFCLGQRERIAEIRKSLPGRIILIRGNHDRSLAAMREAGFEIVHSAVRIDIGDRHWIGRHNPAAFTSHEAAHAVRLLHGHCHGNGYDDDISPAIRVNAYDCSVDALRSLSPVPWDDVSG